MKVARDAGWLVEWAPLPDGVPAVACRVRRVVLISEQMRPTVQQLTRWLCQRVSS